MLVVPAAWRMCRWTRKAIAAVMLEGDHEPIALARQILWLKLKLMLHNGKGII
jgi:hypothetical protein